MQEFLVYKQASKLFSSCPARQRVSTTSCDIATSWGSCRAPSTCESRVFHCGAQGLWKTRKPPTPLQLASILPSAPSTGDQSPVARTSGACSTLPLSASRVLGLKDAHCVWDIAQNAAVRPRPGHHHGNALSPSCCMLNAHLPAMHYKLGVGLLAKCQRVCHRPRGPPEGAQRLPPSDRQDQGILHTVTNLSCSTGTVLVVTNLSCSTGTVLQNEEVAACW